MGMLIIREPWEGYEIARAEHWRVSSYSYIRKVAFHPNGNMAVGELDGSGGINTYLYVNGALRSVIGGMDSSEFQFTRDGKFLVVTSYNNLQVVECETGKIVRTKEIGEMFEDSIDLIVGEEGRFALLTTREDDGTFVRVEWWDPISNTGIPAQTDVKPDEAVWKTKNGFRSAPLPDVVEFDERHMIERPGDKSKYVVRSTLSGDTVCKIKFPEGQLAPQYPSLVGTHGLISPGSPSSFFDLRSGTQIARLFLHNEHPTSYLLVTEDGYFDGNMEPSSFGLSGMRKDSERVWKQLLEGCGIKDK